MHVTVGITVSSHCQSPMTGTWCGSVMVDGASHGQWEFGRDGEITLTGGPPHRAPALTRTIRAAVTAHMTQD